jgi:hypothetical protein
VEPGQDTLSHALTYIVSWLINFPVILAHDGLQRLPLTATQLQRSGSNLAAQAPWLAAQPWSRVLQEFSEVGRPRCEPRDLIAPIGKGAQVFAGVGYGPEIPLTPRWQREAALVNG